jgi:2-phosphosulfolactate phosphatase
MIARCEWGLQGVEALSPRAGVIVIVDVLSFSTAVGVAVARGAEIAPFPYGDLAAAEFEAARIGAVAAYPRKAAGGQLSLSPASLAKLNPGARVLLPSPNGSRLSLATGGTPTLCGALRNAGAVARAAAQIADGRDIAVIAAGERWSDDSLRPAIEDLLGAGAILSALPAGIDLSAEARLAADAFRSTRPHLAETIRDCLSGRELIDRNYGDDVEIALELDASDIVPRLLDGLYRVWSPSAAASRSTSRT